MFRSISIVAVIFCSFLLVRAETISLSGTVTKTGGTIGIPAVKVALVKAANIFATTDANGAFTINGSTTGTISRQRQASSARFTLKGTILFFSPAAVNLTGSVEIFSSSGQRKIAIPLDALSGRNGVTLPDFSSGVNVMRITIGSESFAQTLMRIGNNLYLINETTGAVNQGPISLSKAAAAAVDTLVVSKAGYTTKKTAIDSYNKQNIAITLDTNSGTTGKCTREVLQTAIDEYVAAQKAGDPTKMSLAPQVKYTQNMKDITADKSIVKTALPTIASQRDIMDVDSCRTFTELIVTAGSHPYVVGTRLKVDDGKISEINSMVTDKGDWGFDAAKYLSNSNGESWDILPVAKQSDRQTLINAGNAYFDLIFDWTKDTVPWGDGCYRIEGGNMVAKPCTQGTTGNSVKTTCRTYVVDVDKGAINLFCYFGFGPDSHLFRLENKKVNYIHTLTACNDTVAAGGNCWGTAAKGKAKGYCDWYSH
jgi:hypothetical protein